MSYRREPIKYGRDTTSYSGKCDVRLTKKENTMLNELAFKHGVTRSTIMRKALKDFYKFNTETEDKNGQTS